jgi:Fe-S oxidoreductase
MERIILTVAIAAALASFFVPVGKRIGIVLKGKGRFSTDGIPGRIWRFFKDVIFQNIVITQRPWTGLMHAFVFWGFVAFTIITLNQYSGAYGWRFLGTGLTYQIISIIVGIFAVLVLIGIIYLAIRRFIFRPPTLGEHLSFKSGLVALFIIMLMVTYLIDLFGWVKHGTTTASVNWWIHSMTILAFLALIPQSKHLHLVLAPVTTFLKDFSLIRIHPLDFEKEEFGAETLLDLSKHTLLGAFTCVECGRCFDHCPARLTDKQLDPKQLMLDLRAGLLKDTTQAVVGSVIDEKILWQCTTCGACTFQCPVGIDQAVPIIELRRGLVAGGQFPSAMRPMFDNLEKSFNPWKYPVSQAEEFIEGNDFPLYRGHDILYWMGCMGRYDFYYQKVALAFKSILDHSGISWGILKDEKCTGDAARRAGNEFLFQTLAEMNIEMLNSAAPTTIVTTCPHCLRTLTEYRDMGLKPEIDLVHHTKFIHDLITENRIGISLKETGKAVYHDACYLSRYLGKDYCELPRKNLHAAGITTIEVARNMQHSFCCGAGGAMLFTEEDEGTRINHSRVDELSATGCEIIATACPFCQLMLRDGLADKEKEAIEVRDVAQFVFDQIS